MTTATAPALPVALTPLLGRERALAETLRLLAAGRLLTLTGAGGSGKTRLAMELAGVAARNSGSVVWASLSSIADPALLAQQILEAIDRREPASGPLADVLVERLVDRSLLLVLDNCEHLIEASAALVAMILQRCPGVTVLATSREPLGIAGEQTWLVPPLAHEDAVQLFVERARSADASFAPGPDDQAAIARICERLDGIPLAIELAAARVKVLSTREIAARLGDALRLLASGTRDDPRHRTIHDTIDWSYRLLSPDEQTIFRRLAVFQGSFSFPAAETIAGGEDVLHHLAALVDKSLVFRETVEGDARYRMLATVRAFAAEKLGESGEAAECRARHARFYCDLIEEAEPRLFAGAADPATVARIDREIDNIRAVLDLSDDPPTELRVVYALHWYWFARGHFDEARRRCAAALSHTEGVDGVVVARGRIAAASAASWQGDWQDLRPGIDEAVAVLLGTDDLRARATALTLLGSAMAFGGAGTGEAEAVLRDAVATARRHGRDVGLALALYWSGVAAHLRGDLAAARAAFEEGHRIGVELGNKPAIGHCLTVLGNVARAEGKREEALRCYRAALETHAEIDDRWGLTQAVEGIALLILEKDPEQGTRLLGAAAHAWLQLGARRPPRFEEERNVLIRDACASERLSVALASGAAMDHEAMVAKARALAGEIAGEPAVAAGTRAPLLRVRALGRLEIEAAVVDAQQPPARSREMLLYLLCHPAGRTRDQIAEALWPAVPPSKVRNNFHVTIHRLRKALGGEEWIATDGDRYFANREAIELDADIFEREIAESLRMTPGTAQAERLEQAVSLYRGDFFESARGGEWHLPIRERLRSSYAEGLHTLGRMWLEAGNTAAAATAYQRVVRLDELDEEAARQLMRVLALRGDVAGAGRVYRRLAAALRRELQSIPGPETSELYSRILAR